MSIRMVLILVAVCLGYSGATAQEHSHPTPRQLMIPASLFEKAVNCIKGFEGWHSARHHPYIGYGHRLLPGERLTCNLTKEQADSLLRADLIKRCSTFRRFGKDAGFRQDPEKHPYPQIGVRQPRYLSGIYQLLPLQGQTPRRSSETPENRVRPVLHSVILKQMSLEYPIKRISQGIFRVS